MALPMEDNDALAAGLEQTQNVVQMAAAAAARYNDGTAFICLGARLSFKQLDALSTDFANWLLLEQKLQPGARVAIVLPNLLQYPVAALGILKAGMVIVNINPLYTAPELEYQLRDSGARVLLVSANTAHVAARIVTSTLVERVVVTELGDLHPWPRRALLNFVVRRVKKLVPPFAFRCAIPFRETLRQGRMAGRQRDGDAASVSVTPDTLAVLQYTGGTTGIAKGAMLSHRNLVANTLQLQLSLLDELPGAGAVMVAPLPLYHIYAFTMSLLVALHQGHQALLVPNPRDIDGFVRALKQYRIRGLVGINALYRALAENAVFQQLDFTALQLCSSGGMSLSPQIAARWEQVTGCRIMEGYGLSECSPLVSCNRYREFRARTVGRPAVGTRVLIAGSDGTEALPGEAGEICVKGPQVMQGYWQQPAETANVFDAEGWLHTGDIGIVDQDGYLKVVDRIKDLIIISGFNVYPNEIEDHVCRHPDVVEAAVVGAGDQYEVQIRLFVVCRNASLDEEQLINWCREGLAPYKIPRRVEFRDSLPKNNLGKILRRELRVPAADID